MQFQNDLNCGLESLRYGIPLGIMNMLIFRSVMIIPITLLVTFNYKQHIDQVMKHI